MPVPDQPPRRTRFIDALNMGLKAGQAVGAVAQSRLEKDALLAQARAATGLNDFGDPWFEQPLDVLLEAIRGEARLNRAGRFAAAKQFQHVLRDRLLAQMWFARHPDILARPLKRPVVIVGPMRSGTTRLHRLLASDHRFNYLRSFETISPVPRPRFEEVLGGQREDFRPVLAARIMKVARLANPRTLSIHPTGPYQPEEELGLLAASFWGMKHEAQWQVPSYARWCEEQDATPAYRHMANLLRLVEWSQQASSLRPWVLKTPQHMLDLPALMQVFPDARLIFTHRDPTAVVGSAASLAWNQTIIYSDGVDPRTIGREWLGKTELQIARMRQAREHIPADRMIDVQYEDMERDWRGTMQRIYRFLQLAPEPAIPAMQAYIEETRASKRRPHHYSLEQFGLTGEDVLDRLGDYVRAFDVPLVEGRGVRLHDRKTGAA